MQRWVDYIHKRQYKSLWAILDDCNLFVILQTQSSQQSKNTEWQKFLTVSEHSGIHPKHSQTFLGVFGALINCLMFKVLNNIVLQKPLPNLTTEHVRACFTKLKLTPNFFHIFTKTWIKKDEKHQSTWNLFSGNPYRISFQMI